MNVNPERYLDACDVIDFSVAAVTQQARSLKGGDDVATTRQCFEFVRDEIRHSSDHRLNPVTCRASQTLEHRTGYCYAKSHLLCALLRANGIPAGLCYQRLTIDGEAGPYCLHGLNAVYLSDFGWYRIDARGNRPDVNAQFSPPHERLAFSTDLVGESDLPGIHIRPLPVVVECLQSHRTWQGVSENLPDL